MQVNLNLDERMFIHKVLGFMAVSAGADGNKALGKALSRVSDKVVVNRQVVNLKLVELEVLLEAATRSEHEIESILIPDLEKSDKPDKEEQLTRARETLQVVAALSTKIQKEIERAHEIYPRKR
jgi:hypothetical protein